jgi:small subunit ribosomal protein S1
MGKFRFMDLVDDDDVETGASDPESFGALLEAEPPGRDGNLRELRTNQKVEGLVVQRTADVIFVDLGTKQPGIVSCAEFQDVPLPAVGDKVELYVKRSDGSEITLTRVLHSSNADRDQLKAAWEAGTPIEARIEKAVPGGYQAKVGQARAFIPASHMTLPELADESPKPLATKDPQAAGTATDPFVGKTMRFQVLEIKEGGRNILLSRRGLLREELQEQQRTFLAALVEGETRSARITRLVDFGAFAEVALGKAAAGHDSLIEGLVHVSELSWTRRIRHPGDVLRPGQAATFTVLRVEPDKRRLSLSLRGPMPEDIRLRAEAAAKRSGSGSASTEDQELAAVWRAYEAERQGQGGAPGTEDPAHRHERTSATGRDGYPSGTAGSLAGTRQGGEPASALAAAFAAARKKSKG